MIMSGLRLCADRFSDRKGGHPSRPAAQIGLGAIMGDSIMKRIGKNHHNFIHGMGDSRTYHSWKHIRQRCYNPKDAKYRFYGGRGITICKRWADSFLAFLEDMGECPANQSIDRINNDGNYEPSNCRWATAIQQMNNGSRNHYITHNGRTQTIANWAREADINYQCLWSRIKRGWGTEAALSVPVAEQKQGQGALFE